MPQSDVVICPQPQRERANGGFTLLEVILSLVLSAMLLAAVAMAIEIYLGQLDVGRTEVEQSQLARALLRRMADDLRSAVAYRPIDYAQLVPDPASLAGMDSGSPGESESAESDSTQPSEPESVPGLFGSDSELQLDVSRMPHVDPWSQATAVLALDSAGGPTSEVKTVLYYVADGGDARPATDVGQAQRPHGLVRRETDRATTAYAAQQGNFAALESAGQVLAPEVVAIRFAYFDGSEVTDTWDSTQRDGLPLAVEITLVVEKPRRRAPRPTSMAEAIAQAQRQGDYLVYRQLVHLPSALPTTAEQNEEPEEASP